MVGGPEYAVAVSGESNLIQYSLSSQFLDLGQQPYDKPAEREVGSGCPGQPTHLRSCSPIQS